MDHNQPYNENYLADILSSVKNIAMIGASEDPTKFSYGVLRVLHEQGYNMIPINCSVFVTNGNLSLLLLKKTRVTIG